LAVLSHYVSQICSGKTGYEFLPRQRKQYDLEQTAKKLSSSGFRVGAQTPQILMVVFGENEITIFKRGKIMVKGIEDKKKAIEIAQRLVSLIG